MKGFQNKMLPPKSQPVQKRLGCRVRARKISSEIGMHGRPGALTGNCLPLGSAAASAAPVGAFADRTVC